MANERQQVKDAWNSSPTTFNGARRGSNVSLSTCATSVDGGEEVKITSINFLTSDLKANKPKQHISSGSSVRESVRSMLNCVSGRAVQRLGILNAGSARSTSDEKPSAQTSGDDEHADNHSVGMDFYIEDVLQAGTRKSEDKPQQQQDSNASAKERARADLVSTRVTHAGGGVHNDTSWLSADGRVYTRFDFPDPSSYMDPEELLEIIEEMEGDGDAKSDNDDGSQAQVRRRPLGESNLGGERLEKQKKSTSNVGDNWRGSNGRILTHYDLPDPSEYLDADELGEILEEFEYDCDDTDYY
eukprot:TRINITY_DN30422_c0_g1_i1.p1 TRINITY_DN30422_c0_g1~~TRINITY_DN30422_c0_g1_i1.p1  ORF type:complete len:325 (-),score=58.49 TRINITY_DN30422_c0_g1_i1:50-949(-)